MGLLQNTQKLSATDEDMTTNYYEQEAEAMDLPNLQQALETLNKEYSRLVLLISNDVANESEINRLTEIQVKFEAYAKVFNVKYESEVSSQTMPTTSDLVNVVEAVGSSITTDTVDSSVDKEIVDIEAKLSAIAFLIKAQKPLKKRLSVLKSFQGKLSNSSLDTITEELSGEEAKVLSAYVHDTKALDELAEQVDDRLKDFE